MQFRPVRPTRASNEVIEQIQTAVLDGGLNPGDRLPSERDLATQFGVSRVTIRDALRALEARGLIVVKIGGGGGPSVASPNVEMISEALGYHLRLAGTGFRDLAEVRLALETTAARCAAERRTEADLELMRTALEAGNSKAKAGQVTAASSVSFHQALVGAAHNDALLAMVIATQALTQDALQRVHEKLTDTPAIARRVHRELYDAVLAQDGDRAVRLMREHLYDFAERAEQVLGRKSRSRVGPKPFRATGR
jgi:DNA-binding FadR family transcriptional regulator